MDKLADFNSLDISGYNFFMSEIARALREFAEPIAASVYFAPEANQEYQKLGLSFLPGYFTSRSAPLGIAPGQVVAAVFAVFNPDIVIPSVKEGWDKTTPDKILQARAVGAKAALERLLSQDLLDIADELKQITLDALLNAPIEGHPLFAGLVALDFPQDPTLTVFRICDLIREHRGDSHTIAWTSKGLSGCEITLLSESYWKMAPRSYIFTRGWSKEQVDEASSSLQLKGLIDSSEQITEKGLQLREEIELLTDQMERPILDKISDIQRVIQLLEPLAKKVINNGGFPASMQNLDKTLKKIR